MCDISTPGAAGASDDRHGGCLVYFPPPHSATVTALPGSASGCRHPGETTVRSWQRRSWQRGVVRHAQQHYQVLFALCTTAQACGFGVRGGVISPLRGPRGIANFSSICRRRPYPVCRAGTHVVYAPECASGYSLCITRPVMRSPYGWDKT